MLFPAKEPPFKIFNYTHPGVSRYQIGFGKTRKDNEKQEKLRIHDKVSGVRFQQQLEVTARESPDGTIHFV